MSTNVNLGVKSQQRSTIVLKSSPSAEIASYDYEAAVSQTNIIQSRNHDNEIQTNPIRESASGIKKTTPRDLRIECTPKTVYYSTDKRISRELISTTELATDCLSQQKIKQQECMVCKNIVNESGDEGGSGKISIANLAATKLNFSSKDLVTPVIREMKTYGGVSSTHKEKSIKNSTKIKSSLNNLAKKKIVHPSLLGGNKNSKIPRATTVTCAVARVYQTARIPTKGNSKTTLCTRSLFTSQSKSINRCSTRSNKIPMTKTCDIFEQTGGSTSSIVDINTEKSKASRSNLRKEECAHTKTDPKPCRESPKSQATEAGDHPSLPLTKSVIRNLRLNNACHSCNNRKETVNLELRIHDVQNLWSDSKSSPEIKFPDPWSKTLKTSPYTESTSEEVDLSSEYSSDITKPKKKICFDKKGSFRSPISKSGYMGNSPRHRPRRRARFSFLNTLFDIVFWPFLFLRTNR